MSVTNAAGAMTLTASRILLATGTREMPASARMLPGDRPIGMLTTGALQAYIAFHGLMPFRRPVILGSELVSLSALQTCLSHGARPVAMLEPGPHPLARAPLTWFPRLRGVPFHSGVRILDIQGRTRVEAITFERRGQIETLSCDGILLTGHFTPEAALLWQAGAAIDPGSGGPAVDQNGRCANPLHFAAGNLLRPVETGGWSYREGRAIGRAIAADLTGPPQTAAAIPVTHDDPVKLVVPNLLRRGIPPSPGFDRFQLRVSRRCRGQLSLELDGRTVFQTSGTWRPERRILIPIPPEAPHADHVHVRFAEQP